MTKLDGQKIGIKHCSIRYAAANTNYDETGDKARSQMAIPALAGAKPGPSSSSSSSRSSNAVPGQRTVSAIQAIEHKLRMLQSRTAGDEFKVNRTGNTSTDAPIARYQFNLHNDQEKGGFGKYNSNHKKTHRNQRPYNSSNQRSRR